MTNESATIYIVDDDESLRRSLARLIASGGFNVEVFSSGEEFLESAPLPGDGCVLVDFQLPGMSGLELQNSMHEAGIPFPVVFLSGHSDIPISVNAMKSGAIDFLVKPVDADLLFGAIRNALENYRAGLADQQMRSSILSRLHRLSAREREVLEEVVRGRLNKQIAYDLGIAEKTVKVHRSRVMEKMEATSLAELVHLCHEIQIGTKAPPA